MADAEDDKGRRTRRRMRRSGGDDDDDDEEEEGEGEGEEKKDKETEAKQERSKSRNRSRSLIFREGRHARTRTLEHRDFACHTKPGVKRARAFPTSITKRSMSRGR